MDFGPVNNGTNRPVDRDGVVSTWVTHEWKVTVMHDEIVVGIDDSPSGIAAMQWAATEAIRTKVGLRAIHALSWSMMPEHMDAVLTSDQMPHETMDILYRASITRVFDSVRPRPDWVLQFAEGDARAVLTRQSEDAVLLVVGTPSHVGLGWLLMGSVAHHCLSHATCPVVAVPASLAARDALDPDAGSDPTNVTTLASA